MSLQGSTANLEHSAGDSDANMHPELIVTTKSMQEGFKCPLAPDESNVAVNKGDTVSLSSPDASKTRVPSAHQQAPYQEPSWSGVPQAEYSFEVLKNGTIVSNVDLSKKPYTVFGRFTACDVLMEHPSISRYHAVLQYRATPDPDHPQGFYIYDLDSTHGTFVNKMQIRPRSYHHLRVGHIVKFGGSTKMYILQGPQEDEEEESELTVTQMKELRRQQEKLQAEAEKAVEADEDGRSESEGIDWGLGEDAVEISHENPFALSTANEDLYLDDPKKTLRGWFEREGYDLEYAVEEKGFGHFVCRVQLPIDVAGSDFATAEASVKGKKKEAVVACALEACRILDRYGLLRQSHHEARKRKQKNWEEEDFYESDEDIYLDRTGTIEKKREMRKKMVRKEETVETYDSLVQKLKDVNNQVQELQKKLLQSQSDGNRMDTDNPEMDSLDAYMTSLSHSGDTLDKKMRSKLRLQLAQLQQEQRQLTKMTELARPASLPSLDRISSEGKGSQLKQSNEPSKRLLAMTGSMKGRAPSRIKTVLPTKQADSTSAKVHDTGEEIEEEEEEDSESENDESQKHQRVDNNAVKEKEAEETTEGAKKQETKMIGPSLPQEAQSKASPPASKIRPPLKHKKTKPDDTKCEYDALDPNYAMWIPPEDQSGDGITALNAKYGY